MKKYLTVRREFHWIDKGDILTPFLKISEYCEWLNTLYKGYFRVPSKYYNNSDTKVFIGFFLLITIFFTDKGLYKFECLNLLENILRDDFETTLRIYQLLPAVININNLTIEQELIIENIYEGVSSWLDAWDKKINTYELKNSSINWLEKSALTKSRRYDLIRELHSNKYMEEFLPGHNSTWLLAETSVLLSSIKCDCENVNQMYLGLKKHIDNLNDFGKIPDQYLTNDVLGDFALYIDTVARDKAKINPHFDHNYFRPYLTALRSENANTQKSKLELVTVSHKTSSKPGRKMGQKNRKY